MAKKAEKVAEVVPVVPEKPYVLVEGVDGGKATRVMVPDLVDPRDRVVMVDGVPHEHCAEDGDGRWVYRASR